jgi:hypothetical protein
MNRIVFVVAVGLACVDEAGNDPGVRCTTVTDWRVTFYPAAKKRRR